MKLLKFGIRTWITIASVASFVVGWIMLVHAPKPYQPTQQAANLTLPTLEPLPSLFDSGFGNNGSNFQNQPMLSLQPRPRFGSSFFRTGGS